MTENQKLREALQKLLGVFCETDQWLDPQIFEAVSEAKEALALPTADHLPDSIKRIQIPTITMEQEFQNHYRRGFEAGKRTALQTAAPVDERNYSLTSDGDGPNFDEHFRNKIDGYADHHPTLLVRQLARRLRAEWQARAALALPTAAPGDERALLPCPFCGGAASYIVDETPYNDFPTVECNECSASLSATPNDTKLSAIAAWNNRAALQSGANAKDAERWRKFSGLDYKVRREWASNLSLVPVLTEWVDSLPPIDASISKRGA